MPPAKSSANFADFHRSAHQPTLVAIPWLCYFLQVMWLSPGVGFFLLTLTLVLFFGSHTVPSSDPPCTTRRLPVSFRDAQNVPLQNVSVDDLEAKIHGKPAKILSLTPDPRPHRLVLIMDASASMGMSQGETPLWTLELSLA